MTNLFCGNFPWSTTEEDLGNFFSQIGQVSNVRIVLDRETGRSRGFGFVTFANDTDVDTCIQQMNGCDFNGRNLRLDRAERKQFNNQRQGGF